MASGQERFIAQLEQTAKRVDIMSPNEISSLFRRAALRLRKPTRRPGPTRHLAEQAGWRRAEGGGQRGNRPIMLAARLTDPGQCPIYKQRSLTGPSEV